MTTPRLSERLVAGENDYPHFAEGWHERTADGRCAVEYRSAAGREGIIVLRRASSATRVVLLLSGPRGLVTEVLRGTISVNGAEVPLQLDADLWVIREVPLPPADTQGDDRLEIRLVLPDPPCADDVLHNGDTRRLGWYVSAVWQE